MNAPAPIPLDDLARALDRARGAHARRPDDHRLYAAMLEAEVAYLTAELARRDRIIGMERRRASEIARRLSAARKVSREIQQITKSSPCPMDSPPTGGTRSQHRQRTSAPAPLPLLEFAGLPA